MYLSNKQSRTRLVESLCSNYCGHFQTMLSSASAKVRNGRTSGLGYCLTRHHDFAKSILKMGMYVAKHQDIKPLLGLIGRPSDFLRGTLSHIWKYVHHVVTSNHISPHKATKKSPQKQVAGDIQPKCWAGLWWQMIGSNCIRKNFNEEAIWRGWGVDCMWRRAGKLWCCNHDTMTCWTFWIC